MRDGAAPLVVAILAVIALELVHTYAGLAWARGGAHLAMAAVVIAALPRFGLREAYLLALSGALAAALYVWHPEPWAAALAALDQAVFLMAFLLAIMLTQEAALTSRSVERLGTFLARQPGGRRYVGMYTGTMTMSVLFNLGTLSLLAPLIRRAADRAADDPLTPVRERRQLNAVLRGFAWSVVWSPTAVAPLALLGLIDGIDRPRWIALGLLLAFVMLAVGWLEDRWQFRHHSARARGQSRPPPPAMPWGALWRFLAVSVVLAALVLGLMTATGLGLPPSMIGAAPILMVAWLVAQTPSDPVRVRVRLAEIVTAGLPRTAPAAVTLACSGFVGIAGAALIDAEALAAWIGLDAMAAWVFMLGTTFAVLVFSQFALSPIMMAVFFGAILGALPSLPADPTLTALAVASGWALANTGSPFASGVIFLARVTGHATTELTYRWNGIFTTLCFAVLALAYWLMTGGT